MKDKNPCHETQGNLSSCRTFSAYLHDDELHAKNSRLKPKLILNRGTDFSKPYARLNVAAPFTIEEITKRLVETFHK